jgi:hypothetical protein
MPDAHPKVFRDAPSPGVEPASDAGIGVAMQDFATPVLAPREPAPEAVPRSEAPEFDAWLRSHLSQLHAGVLAEPVPDRFLRLLDQAAD